MDATTMAEGLGNERASNVVLLGALSAALDFTPEEWEHALVQFVPKKTIGVNLKAFRLGRAWIEEARVARPAPSHAPSKTKSVQVQPATAQRSVRLEITAEWCKSCDICVKLCPERCLRLNADRVAELAQPEKCTGCRVCEWLCPDFAIRVHLDNPAVEGSAA
jgi:indolepyruvate ferredoxin oxidoreductase beta subunit